MGGNELTRLGSYAISWVQTGDMVDTLDRGHR
jgi:hypothetical protein